jgi:hypothetical protein
MSREHKTRCQSKFDDLKLNFERGILALSKHPQKYKKKKDKCLRGW